MSDFREIVVLGPTGNIGSALSRLLMKKGVAFRTGNRKDFDYYKPETYAPLLSGATDLFLVIPFSESLVEVTDAIITQAEKCGVQRVIKVSALGANEFSSDPIQRLHGLADARVLRSSIKSIILRPNAFMQNFIQFYGLSIRKSSLIPVPAGKAEVSFIDADDIAKVAFESFMNFEKVPQFLDITGKESLSFESTAKILSRVLGREIKYSDLPASAFQSRLESLGVPPSNIKALLAMYSSYQRGEAAPIRNDFQLVTGTLPKSFENFVKENSNALTEGASQ